MLPLVQFCLFLGFIYSIVYHYAAERSTTQNCTKGKNKPQHVHNNCNLPSLWLPVKQRSRSFEYKLPVIVKPYPISWGLGAVYNNPLKRQNTRKTINHHKAYFWFFFFKESYYANLGAFLCISSYCYNPYDLHVLHYITVEWNLTITSH